MAAIPPNKLEAGQRAPAHLNGAGSAATGGALRHSGEVTRLLAVIGGEGPDAQHRLLEMVYQELRCLADQRLRGDPAGWIMRTTSMVHEAYLRLVGSAEMEWKCRAHFFGAAAEAMRRILVERIRAARSLKRGGGQSFETLDETTTPSPAPHQDIDHVDVLAVHEALERLERLDARKAEVVKLRFFAGLDVEETALALEISERTAHREWDAARIWLFREMNSA